MVGKSNGIGYAALLMVLCACGGEPAIEPPLAPSIEIAEPASATEAPDELVEETYSDRWTKALLQAEESSGRGTPALWKVSDYDSTVSDRLIVEVDIHSRAAYNEMIRLMRHYGLFPQGRSLLDYISDEDAERLRATEGQFALDYEQMIRIKPWLLEEFLKGETTLSENGFERASGVEEVLMARARKAGTSIGYIENLDDQISIVPTASINDQVSDLLDLVEVNMRGDSDASSESDGETLLDTLVAEWLDGDVEGLGLLAGNISLESDKAYYEALLVERNQNWIPKIKVMLNIPGNTFVAVGAAHLVGPDSVITMLEDKRLNVERIL